MSGDAAPVGSGALQSGLDAIQQQQNGNELQMYKFSAQSSFEQTMTQTYGNLAVNAAKAKPQV